MFRQFELTFINTFDERVLQLMCYNSYNSKLSVIAKRLDTSSRTYMSLAQSNFQRPCNLSKRSNLLVLLLTTDVTPPYLKLGRPYKIIFLTVVACEIGRNSYFAGTDQRTGSGVWWELWVICWTTSDPLEVWISLGSAFFAYFLFRQIFPLASIL